MIMSTATEASVGAALSESNKRKHPTEFTDVESTEAPVGAALTESNKRKQPTEFTDVKSTAGAASTKSKSKQERNFKQKKISNAMKKFESTLKWVRKSREDIEEFTPGRLTAFFNDLEKSLEFDASNILAATGLKPFDHTRYEPLLYEKGRRWQDKCYVAIEHLTTKDHLSGKHKHTKTMHIPIFGFANNDELNICNLPDCFESIPRRGRRFTSVLESSNVSITWKTLAHISQEFSLQFDETGFTGFGFGSNEEGRVDTANTLNLCDTCVEDYVRYNFTFFLHKGHKREILSEGGEEPQPTWYRWRINEGTKYHTDICSRIWSSYDSCRISQVHQVDVNSDGSQLRPCLECHRVRDTPSMRSFSTKTASPQSRP